MLSKNIQKINYKSIDWFKYLPKNVNLKLFKDKWFYNFSLEA